MGNFITNEKSIYDHENNFPKINSCQFIHSTWGGVWVVIAISSNNYCQCYDPTVKERFWFQFLLLNGLEGL